ncbi:MAG TPA: ABC transporter permease [Planctomycetota bacterium]|jgi:putative ABC transport system permease protein|nr:ABC transporter permease [Planctomycetota bacterium]
MSGSRLWRTVILGVRSLALHKLRSALTVLGIIFGVSSVIAMLSIGEGANFEAQEEIKKLGSHNVILRSKKPSDDQSSGYEQTEVTAYGLRREDFDRIEATCPTLKMLVPMRVIPTDARYRQQNITAQVIATTPDYFTAANIRLARGRQLTHNDLDTVRPVCVIGAAIARALYLADDPIDNDVKVGSYYFRIIGILEETGAATGTGGSEASDRNRDIYVPITTAQKRYGDLTVKITSGSQIREQVELHQIICALRSDEDVPATSRALRGLLERFHTKPDFEVIVPLELLEQKERTKRIFNIVLGSIAAISLLVGGIGIMNIMLASILERTREIGVRRALGAKQRDILTQFLVETVVLSTSGGLLGVCLGITIPYVVEAASGMKTIITAYSIVLSFGISAGVGVVFGLYPARRASMMDPIDALRRE